jgi:hypothetical protein
MKKIIYLLTLVLGFYFSGFAQKNESIPVEETLKFINKKLGSNIVFDLKDGDIIVKFYDNKNKLFRVDQTDTENLDWKGISYAEEDNLIMIPCYGNKVKCIERKFPLKDEGDSYVRCTIKLTKPEDFQPLKNAITHLLRTVEEFDYKSTTPFE